MTTVHVMELAIGLIEHGHETQARLSTNDRAIADYAEVLTSGGELDPIVVYFDGADYWAADGFHRIAAHIEAGRDTIRAEVLDGSKDDAILHACAANAKHGVPRTPADKRRAIELVMANPKSRKWSDQKIADHCCVTKRLVGEVRSGTGAHESVREGKDGRTFDVSRKTKKGAVLVRAHQDEDSEEDDTPLVSEDQVQFELMVAPYRRAANDLTRIKSDMKELADDRNLGGHLINKITRITGELDVIRAVIQQSAPGAWCEACDRQGCKKCAQMGWITAEQVAQKKRR